MNNHLTNVQDNLRKLLYQGTNNHCTTVFIQVNTLILVNVCLSLLFVGALAFFLCKREGERVSKRNASSNFPIIEIVVNLLRWQFPFTSCLHRLALFLHGAYLPAISNLCLQFNQQFLFACKQ